MLSGLVFADMGKVNGTACSEIQHWSFRSTKLQKIFQKGGKRKCGKSSWLNLPGPEPKKTLNETNKLTAIQMCMFQECKKTKFHFITFYSALEQWSFNLLGAIRALGLPFKSSAAAWQHCWKAVTDWLQRDASFAYATSTSNIHSRIWEEF